MVEVSGPDPELVPALRPPWAPGALVVHFQPEVDLAAGVVVGMQALLRWRHPDRGLLWPDAVRAAAAAAGTATAVQEWLIADCAAHAAGWPDRVHGFDGRPETLSVDLAADTLGDAAAVTGIEAVLGRAALPAGRLRLATSAAGVAALGRSGVAALRRLRDAGAQIALDDLLPGTPVDALVLHRARVRRLADQAGTLAAAREAGCYLVAETVESWADGVALLDAGVDRGSGYLFRGPQRAPEAARMLGRGFGWRPDPVGRPGTLSPA